MFLAEGAFNAKALLSYGITYAKFSPVCNPTMETKSIVILGIKISGHSGGLDNLIF